jgi:hypothetical protein
LSISGVTGKDGQAVHIGANEYLNSLVQYRTCLGLEVYSLHIGTVEDVGYVSKDGALPKRMKLAGAYGITAPEMTEAVSVAAQFHVSLPLEPPGSVTLL